MKKKLIHHILIFAICVALGACNISLSPERQLRHLRPLPSMDNTAARVIAEKQLFQRGDWPRKDWWRIYHSHELNSLMRRALKQNPSLLEACNRIVVAQQKAIVTRSVLYPLVYFSPYVRNLLNSHNGLFRAFNHTYPIQSHVADLSLTFRYEIDFWNKYHNLFYASIGKAKAEAAEYAQMRLMISTALAQAYFAYQTNLYRRDLFQQLVIVREKLAHLILLLEQKGLRSALPYYAAIEELEQAKKYLAGINEEIAVDQHLINILVGSGPETPVPVGKKLASLPKKLVLPQTLSLDLIARRPDLMAQIWRAKALAHEAGAAVSEFYPNVNVIGLLGFQSTHWRSIVDLSSGQAEITPAISLPIFTAGAIRAQANVKTAKFDVAIQAYNQLLLTSTKEVLDAIVLARSITKQKQDQVQLVNFAQKSYNLTVLREQKGLDSDLNCYYYQVELLQKQLDEIVLIYNQYVASIKLTKALGGGYCQDRVPLINRS